MKKSLLLRMTPVLLGGVGLKTFVILAMMLGIGCGSAMADGEVEFTEGKVIGDVNNSGGWYYGKSQIFEIPANKTLTLKFKTYSATDDQLKGKGENGADLSWGAHMSHVMQLWGFGVNNLFWRADGYGWLGENNTNGTGWFAYLGSNTRWGLSADPGVDYDGQLFREDITGSDVVFTVTRVGGELRMTQDITATSGKYRKYFVVNYGSFDGSVWAQLSVERAHVVVSEDYSITDTDVPSITGTLIGLENNTTPFWSAWSDYFTVKPDETLTLRYKNYTNRLENYFGALPYVTTDFDRGATGYFEYFGLRPDNWVNIAAKNADECNFGEVLSWNWADFREKIDGATVTLTVTREGNRVKVREEFAPADGSTMFYEEYSQECGDGTQNIRVFLTADHAHLDLLPVTAEVGTYGWATFSSDYALDFSKASDGLTAYKITGHSGNVVTKEEVTGTVPAGTGLLLKGSAGSYNIPIVGSATDVTDNLLVAGTGASVSAEAGKTRYVLGVNGSAAEFQKIISTPATVAKGKAYLQFNEEIAARALSFEDESTGVMAIDKVQPAVDNVYDLSGRKIVNGKSVNGKLQRGLYIVNGKKVVVK